MVGVVCLYRAVGLGEVQTGKNRFSGGALVRKVSYRTCSDGRDALWLGEVLHVVCEK